ncbi:LysR family transcriptional regulator [Streptomyces shenzhenensis]|uniref:LysR family transcriptional regulator n=1 Tax=Streptomyces shenzhenensis TaxID=943815 RepID=A0A3M0HVH8_9ACTN|nr:LysR family transcriptional regulator [Streptomyces shenzhenensis]RMB79672.1 LysR family transcriptional regulator [Streptomyces shenzhenensis]
MVSADNFRVFLELARSKRLGDAAQRLQMDQTTVSRRLGRLEQELNVRLFDRGVSGWTLTEAGRRVLPHAESMETILAAAMDSASPRTGALAGTVRVLSPDGFGAYLLIPALSDLRERHDDLMVEVFTSTTHDLITGRDFDIAITLEKPSRRLVEVHKLADYDLGLYASAEYLERHGAPRDRSELAEHPFIWYLDSLLDVQPLKSLAEHLAEARLMVQTNNITGHYTAARQGLGIAPLPTYIGDAEPGLVRVLPRDFTVTRTYWVVIPKDLVRLGRVNAIGALLKQIVDDSEHLRA